MLDFKFCKFATLRSMTEIYIFLAARDFPKIKSLLKQSLKQCTIIHGLLTTYSCDALHANTFIAFGQRMADKGPKESKF